MSDLACVLHKQPLSHYCETCRDPICSTCMTTNPHFGPLHQSSPLHEAALLRRSHFSSYVSSAIHPLLNEAQKKVIDLTVQKQALDMDEKIILKDIVMEFQGMERRLNLSSQKEVNELQSKIKYLSGVANILDDLAYTFENVMNNPGKFLQLYSEFDSKLKHLETINVGQMKGQSQQVEEENRIIGDSYNALHPSLPRQMQSTLLRIQSLPSLIDRNQFLNELVKKCITKHHTELKQAMEQCEQERRRINLRYNEMNRSILGLRAYRVCQFCSVAFSIAQVNECCTRKNKMHFWVEMNELKLPSLQSHVLVRTAEKKHFRGMLRGMQVLRCRLIEYQINSGKEWSKVFEKERVSVIGLLYGMNVLGIQEQKARIIAQLLKEEDGMISVERVREFMRNPMRMYEEFVRKEEEMEKNKPIGPATLTKFRY